ncbi:MAG TPA: hypothetical protein VFN70_18045 [Burkholderiales bacterium]|nr:hypothetical protein [Burkholderiales bacterium]
MGKPSPALVNSATDRARHRIDLITSRALRITLDAEMPKRHAAGECRHCFYIGDGRICGQAFTEWTCTMCETPQEAWPNTGTPQLCLSCATRYGLCRNCLADDGLRSRRRINIVRHKPRKRFPASPLASEGQKP